jgi:hypothetical protein
MSAPTMTARYAMIVGYDATTLCVPGPMLPAEQKIMQNVEHPVGMPLTPKQMREYGEGVAKCLGGRLLAICQVEVAS